MKKWADTKRQDIEYEVGDLVIVKFLPQPYKSLRKAHKGLIRKRDGSFPIIKRVGKVAYQVQLLSYLKIHNVFHVSCLKPYHQDKEDPSRRVSHRAPPNTMVSFDWDVEYIMADTLVRGRGISPTNEYLVKWRDLSEKEASREHADTL